MATTWQGKSALVKASEMFAAIRKDRQKTLKCELAELSGIDDFEIDEERGAFRGSNAVVHCVTLAGSSKRGRYALKRMYANNVNGILGFKLEMQVPLEMDHPNVMGVYKSFDDKLVLPSEFEREFVVAAARGDYEIAVPAGHDWNKASYGLLAWMDGCTLKKWYKDGNRCDTYQVAAIAMQIIDGLAYIHRRGYCFNDLKDDNVMFVKPAAVWRDGADLGTDAGGQTVPPVTIVDLGEAFVGLDQYANGLWFPGCSILASSRGAGREAPRRADDHNVDDARFDRIREPAPVLIPSRAAVASAQGASLPPRPPRRGDDSTSRSRSSSSTSTAGSSESFVWFDPRDRSVQPSDIESEDAAARGFLHMRVKTGAAVTCGPEITCHESRMPELFDGAKCDMWALGRLIVTMTTLEGEKYPQTRGVDKVYRKLARSEVPPTRAQIEAARPRLPDAFATLQPLVDALLEFDPAERANTERARDLCAQALWTVPIEPGPDRDARIADLADVMVKMWRDTKQLQTIVAADGTKKTKTTSLWRLMLRLNRTKHATEKDAIRAWRVPLSTFGGSDEGDVMLLHYLASVFRKSGAHIKPIVMDEY